MKRAALFFMYDKQGIVDRYVLELLKDIKTNVDKLVIIVNGSLNDEGVKAFDKISDKVIYRENKGFDVYAYRCGLSYLRSKDINVWDEVVMFNFTNFGSVYPFSEAFDKMDEIDVDFWGLTMHHGMKEDPYCRCRYGCIPEHIQSSFIAVRRSLFSEDEFWDYWDNMPAIDDYVDAIVNHEAVFTKYFLDMGYRYASYVDTSDLKDIHPYPLMMMPKFLIEERRCPVLKERHFLIITNEFLDVSTVVRQKSFMII